MIKLNNISKSFNKKIIFENLSLEFQPGEHYGLMGSSGYGKTTLISIISGLIKPDRGNLTVKGKISLVFQENRLLNQLTSLENLNIVSANQDKNISILNALGLGDDLHTLIPNLSGGMKRRVAIGRALAFKHDILILDEPFKGLDSQTLEQTINLIRDLEKHKTLILITHNYEEAKKLNCKIINLT
ncbi:MAG: ATP-binding cassette domain-containing protein [Filifactoraceae bacterium]